MGIKINASAAVDEDERSRVEYQKAGRAKPRMTGNVA
jgi:hypothetical protein